MSDSIAGTHDELFDSLLGDFLDESGQLLERLNENLLQLDEWVRSLGDDHSQHCDDELLNEMFRSAHSLKGLSAMLGLGDINNLTHKIENVFDAARKDELIIDGDVVELMFQGWDRLVALIEVLKDPAADAVECDSLIDNICDLLQAAGADKQQSSQADAERALAGALDEACQDEPPPAIDHFENLEDETEIPDKYLSIFVDETEISLDNFTETLLALENGGSPDELKKLLVIAHRVKGSAASIALNRAAKLAHLIEDLLQSLLEEEDTLSARAADAMLEATDALRQYIEDLRGGEARSDHFSELAGRLLAASSSRQSTAAAQAAAGGGGSSDSRQPETPAGRSAGISGEMRRQIAASAAEGLPAFAGEVQFQPGLPLAGLKAQLVYEKLSNLGQVCYCDPPLEKLEQIDELDRFRFGFSSETPRQAIEEQLRIAGVERLIIEPLSAASSQSAPAQPPAAETGPEKPAQTKGRTSGGSGKPTETVRVDIDRLDQLMNLAGELVINRARFSQIGERLKSNLGGKQSVQALSKVFGALSKMGNGGQFGADGQSPAVELEKLRNRARRIQNELETVRRDVQALAEARGSINDLLEAIHQLGRVSDGIQQGVMDTRMVPIGPLFARFKRVIRDITRSNGKSIELITNGEKTELDKRMIDELGDPLIHMVRNSADHGVELPEERQKAGKPAQGTVTLNAFHRGNSIIIQVIDDGKGLDADRIRQKCLDKGIISPSDAEKMTPQQIYQMIWEPGLSTAEKVTEVSGRGMGMDIVKSKIEDLNGSVEVDSAPGKGTTMTIKLPLTLAILPSLMVEIADDTFAMPMEAVTEIVSVGRRDLSTVQGRWTARVRGRIISVVKLEDVLDFHSGDGRNEEHGGDETTLVIVGEREREIGLCVNRVIGEEDVVIKSMADNYRNVAGVAGASILGDGRVSLILDVPTLIEMSAHGDQSNSVAAAC